MATATPAVAATPPTTAVTATPAEGRVSHALFWPTLGVVAAFIVAVVSVYRAASSSVGCCPRPGPVLSVLVTPILLGLTPAAAASATATVATVPAVSATSAVDSSSSSTARINAASTISTMTTTSSSSNTSPIGSGAVGDTSRWDEALKRVARDAPRTSATSGAGAASGRCCGRGSRSAVVADVEPLLVVSVASTASPEPSSGPAAAAAAADVLVAGARREHYTLFYGVCSLYSCSNAFAEV